MATNVILTINLATKECTQSVDVAFREVVAVLLVNAPAGTSAGDLRLYLTHGNMLMADCVAFSAFGQDFLGDLDLETSQLATLFGNALSNEKRTLDLTVYDLTQKALLVNWKLVVQNNPWAPGMTAPTAADPISV